MFDKQDKSLTVTVNAKVIYPLVNGNGRKIVTRDLLAYKGSKGV